MLPDVFEGVIRDTTESRVEEDTVAPSVSIFHLQFHQREDQNNRIVGQLLGHADNENDVDVSGQWQ